MLIRIKDDRYFEQNNYLYQLLQKFLNKSYKNYFNLNSFWLYNEFLLSSNKDNKEISVYKRYDEILRNIIQILNKLLNSNDINLINHINDYTTFICFYAVQILKISKNYQKYIQN